MQTQELLHVNGTRLYVEQIGDGEPVILLHGLTLDLRMWNAQIAALSPGFRTIAYDMRGHGRSDDTTERYSDREDLAALMDALHLPSAHIIGLSRGGRMALDFASNFPQRVASLITIATSLRLPGSDMDSSGEIKSDVSKLLKAGRSAEACARWLQSPLWQSPHGGIDSFTESMVRSYFEAGHTWDAMAGISLTKELLLKVQARTLVMIGENDLPEMLRSAQQLQELLPHATTCRIPGAGHITTGDQPERVNQAIVAFLAFLNS